MGGGEYGRAGEKQKMTRLHIPYTPIVIRGLTSSLAEQLKEQGGYKKRPTGTARFLRIKSSWDWGFVAMTTSIVPFGARDEKGKDIL